MATFGSYSGPIDYWMLVTDWRNGSIAIMLAIGALVVGYFARPPLCRKWATWDETKSGTAELGIEHATASTAVVISGRELLLARRGVQFGTDTVRRDAP
jgi:hypothetical protein